MGEIALMKRKMIRLAFAEMGGLGGKWARGWILIRASPRLHGALAEQAGQCEIAGAGGFQVTAGNGR